MTIASQTPGLRRTSVLWGGGVFGVALLVRALWAAYADGGPLDGRFDDSVFYHFAGGSLAAGRGYISAWTGDTTALMPPGYPFFLAGLYKAFGTDPVVAEAANAALGALSCVLAFALATALFDRRAGLLAGFGLALFPGQVLFVPAVMSEALFTFLLLAALLLAVIAARAGRRNVWLVAAVGVVSGAAALARGEGLLIPLIVAPFWALVPGKDWRRGLRLAAVALATAVLVVLPWSVRNYVVLDEPVFISSNVGGNLYMGRFVGTVERVRAVDELRQPHTTLTLREQELGLNRDGWREGMKLALTKPWREFRIFPPKLKALYDRDDDFLLHVEGFLSGRRLDEPLRGSLQVVANGYYFATLSLALVGGALATVGRRRGGIAAGPVLLASAVAVWTLAETLMLADSRYHFPLIPVLTVGAAATLSAGLRRAPALDLKSRLSRGEALPAALGPLDRS